MKDYLENPENIKMLKKIFYLSLLLIVAIDFFVYRGHAVFLWERIPGFSALYGFISCVLIIGVYKAMGYIGLIKKEDYYDH